MHSPRLLLLLTAALAIGACDGGPEIRSAAVDDSVDGVSTPVPGDTTAAQVIIQHRGPRRIRTEMLDTLWHRGGAVDDTLLLNPFSMVADDEHVYVYDSGANRIVAFDAATGQPLWVFGRRGGGPGEFGEHPRLALGPDSGLRVLDRVNHRFLDIAPGGTILRELPYRTKALASHSCALADGTTLITSHGEETDALHIGEDGTVVDRVPLPWPDLDTIPGLARQGTLVQTGDGRTCIFGFSMGRGFTRISATGAGYAAHYVEDFDLARAKVVRSARRVETSFAHGAVYATMSLSVDRDTLVTLFRGPRGEFYKRFLDHYDVESGRYLYSRLLDLPVQDADRAGGTYFVFSVDGDFPSLTALVPR